jgi:hypothetical protein
LIVAARIRNETEATQREILSRCANLQDGKSVVITKDEGLRLIVGYSEKRAKKDAHNRERGVTRLQKRVRSGQLTKEHLNNRGYNKFLRLQGEVTIEIDESKIADVLVQRNVEFRGAGVSELGWTKGSVYRSGGPVPQAP